jgi:hypothetical protein
MHTMDGHATDKERKHKSKKRDRHGDADDKRKHKKRKEKEAVIRVVDDDLDEDMWVEKNIDMDGEKVREVHIFEISLSNGHSEATCDRHTYCREPQVDLACPVQP